MLDPGLVAPDHTAEVRGITGGEFAWPHQSPKQFAPRLIDLTWQAFCHVLQRKKSRWRSSWRPLWGHYWLATKSSQSRMESRVRSVLGLLAEAQSGLNILQGAARTYLSTGKVPERGTRRPRAQCNRAFKRITSVLILTCKEVCSAQRCLERWHVRIASIELSEDLNRALNLLG
jgi:hypothetical protein